jgi:hypothetical protein
MRLAVGRFKMNSPSKLWVLLSAVPHAQQRYDTVGDWYLEPSALVVTVSQELPRKEQFLVAIHELVEAFLCECDEINAAEVDDFDMARGCWAGVHPASTYPAGTEPGDMIEAPYHYQHQIATEIERTLAAEAGVDWLAYEQRCQELSK